MSEEPPFDLDTGQVRQVTASGTAEVVPLDRDRARRKLMRYLGDDEQQWDARFRGTPGATALVRLVPDKLDVRDLSFGRHAAAERLTS